MSPELLLVIALIGLQVMIVVLAGLWKWYSTHVRQQRYARRTFEPWREPPPDEQDAPDARNGESGGNV